MVSRTSLKTKSPAISVLLPVYNAEEYVANVIESILQQTFADFEFIIIDDYSYQDRLEKQFKFMELHSKVGIVGGIMEIINETGKVIGKRKYSLSDSEIRKRIFWYSPFSHPLVMIKKSILDKVGYYNPAYVPVDDYELYFRIGKESKFANLPDVLLQYRIIKSSMTYNLTRKMELATFKVRSLYAKDKHYKMSKIDQFLNVIQYFSFFIIPPRIRISLFNLLRNTQ